VQDPFEFFQSPDRRLLAQGVNHQPESEKAGTRRASKLENQTQELSSLSKTKGANHKKSDQAA
jgi:hypothetical protein